MTSPGLVPERPLWRSALPLILLFAGTPLWWALGAQVYVWPVFAAPLLLWLIANRRSLEVPPLYLVFFGFLAWVLLSAVALTTSRYAAAYLMRLVLYTSALVIGLYVWNALRRGLPHRPLLWAIVVLWTAAILLSFPGMVSAGLGFTSPVEWLLNSAGIHQSFLIEISHPQFSEWDAVYLIARPSPLYAYTNGWGSAVGVMTPIVVYTAITERRHWLRRSLYALLAVAAVPILVSVNRGCWISIVVAVGYVVARRTLRGDLRALAAVVVAAVGLVVGVMFTPLNALIAERFSYSNTSTRATLYHASLALAERSPLVGYGSPQSSAGIADSNDVSVGTHGQLWTVLVSQGFVGAALFIGLLVTMVWTFRPRHGGVPEVWLHAAGLVTLVQIAFYEVMPDAFCFTAIALSICALRAGHYAPAAPPPNLSFRKPEGVRRERVTV